MKLHRGAASHCGATCLKRIPRALLAISPLSSGAGDAQRRLFGAAGIALQRTVVLPAGRNEAENQARYGVVDLALDPLPYGGVNGTLEALDMGVPVVTLCGRRHGERSAYSILANLGVLDTVAHDPGEYVAIAARLTDDRTFSAQVRAAIRAGLARSLLIDMDAHTRNLERAYLTALERRYPAALAGSLMAAAGTGSARVERARSACRRGPGGRARAGCRSDPRRRRRRPITSPRTRCWRRASTARTTSRAPRPTRAAVTRAPDARSRTTSTANCRSRDGDKEGARRSVARLSAQSEVRPGTTLPGDTAGRAATPRARSRRSRQTEPVFDPARAGMEQLGNTLRTRDRLDEAEAAFARAVALKPDYWLAAANLGAVQRDLGAMDRAEATLRTALGRAGPNPYRPLVVLLAGVLRLRGILDESVQLYVQALNAAQSKSAGEWFNLGLVLAERNDPAGARNAYGRARALDPTDLALCSASG